MTADHSRSVDWPLSVGPPVWACDEWADHVYPAGTRRKDFLHWYSRTFNVVEGNGTFYGVPGESTFQSWADQAAEGFEFCFKVPRAITHDAMLSNTDAATDEFVDRLNVVAAAGKLGPTLLQLGPNFSPRYFDPLARFLDRWPADLPIAVEVRHDDWFDDPNHERPTSIESRLDGLLSDRAADRVLFDSRALFAAEPDDPIERKSQSRKPNPPPRTTTTGNRPMVRMVGRNQIERCDDYLKSWCKILAEWINQGKRPIFFTHAPDDAVAPSLARRLMSFLQSRLPDYDLTVPSPPPAARSPIDDQPMLF